MQRKIVAQAYSFLDIINSFSQKQFRIRDKYYSVFTSGFIEKRNFICICHETTFAICHCSVMADTNAFDNTPFINSTSVSWIVL